MGLGFLASWLGTLWNVIEFELKPTAESMVLSRGKRDIRAGHME